jgi:hypothetical protein
MSDIFDHLCQFLDASGLEANRGAEHTAQFWYKEERYYVRFLPQRQGIRIVHPRVWSVASHLEFGIATFVANDMNQDSFATKCFVNNDDHHVYAAVEVFAPDAESVGTSFFNYMNTLSGAIVEFRDRMERSMQEEENQEPPPPHR